MGKIMINNIEYGGSSINGSISELNNKIGKAHIHRYYLEFLHSDSNTYTFTMSFPTTAYYLLLIKAIFVGQYAGVYRISFSNDYRDGISCYLPENWDYPFYFGSQVRRFNAGENNIILYTPNGSINDMYTSTLSIDCIELY